MKIKNNELTVLTNILHSSNINLRLVSYLAIGEVIASKLITNNELTKDYDKTINIKIKKIINFINELAIVDIVMLEKSILNVLNYKLSKQKLIINSNNIYNITSFEDVLGVNKYFSSETINIINNNFTLYRDTMLATLNASNSIMEVTDGN